MKNTEYSPYNSAGVVDHYSRVYTGFWEEFPEYLAEDFTEAVKQVPKSQGLVLCVGSGLGDEAEMLKNYDMTPVCIDGSLEMVRVSARKGLTTVQGNFLDLPFSNNRFDGVFTYKTLNHAVDLMQLQRGLSEIGRVLKPKGALSICMLRGRQTERKSSFLDGVTTRENLFLTEETFHQVLVDKNFLVEASANIRRGHTDYMIANAINFNRS